MEKTHAVYSTKTKIVRLIIWLFLAFVAVITIFPVCYVIFGSFKDNKELLVGGSSILPQKWVFDNYVQAWKQANFATYTMNSVFLSLAVMLISLINASMAGYVFARKNFKGCLLYTSFAAELSDTWNQAIYLADQVHLTGLKSDLNHKSDFQ